MSACCNAGPVSVSMGSGWMNAQLPTVQFNPKDSSTTTRPCTLPIERCGLHDVQHIHRTVLRCPMSSTVHKQLTEKAFKRVYIPTQLPAEVKIRLSYTRCVGSVYTYVWCIGNCARFLYRAHILTTEPAHIY